MNRLDVSPVRAEWDAMMAEYEGDNNHDHFQRDADVHRSEITRSCRPSCGRSSSTSWSARSPREYSGCMLYNEIRKNVDNPDIKQLMTLHDARRVAPCQLHQPVAEATSASASTSAT